MQRGAGPPHLLVAASSTSSCASPATSTPGGGVRSGDCPDYKEGTVVALIPEPALRSCIDRQYHHEAMFRLAATGAQGYIARYTGLGVALVRFFTSPTTTDSATAAWFSLPTRCLVPVEGAEPVPVIVSPTRSSMMGSPSPSPAAAAAAAGATANGGNKQLLQQSRGSVRLSGGSSSSSIMCVVCGRCDRKGELRSSGFKCKECIGHKSSANLKALAAASGRGSLL
eukprot:PhM_4_TR427/c6_g1_i1/m.14919